MTDNRDQHTPRWLIALWALWAFSSIASLGFLFQDWMNG